MRQSWPTIPGATRRVAGMRWRGPWVSDVTYLGNDVVLHDHIAWVAEQAITGATPTATSPYWSPADFGAPQVPGAFGRRLELRGASVTVDDEVASVKRTLEGIGAGVRPKEIYAIDVGSGMTPGTDERLPRASRNAFDTVQLQGSVVPSDSGYQVIAVLPEGIGGPAGSCKVPMADEAGNEVIVTIDGTSREVTGAVTAGVELELEAIEFQFGIANVSLGGVFYTQGLPDDTPGWWRWSVATPVSDYTLAPDFTSGIDSFGSWITYAPPANLFVYEDGAHLWGTLHLDASGGGDYDAEQVGTALRLRDLDDGGDVGTWQAPPAVIRSTFESGFYEASVFRQMRGLSLNTDGSRMFVVIIGMVGETFSSDDVYYHPTPNPPAEQVCLHLLSVPVASGVTHQARVLASIPFDAEEGEPTVILPVQCHDANTNRILVRHASGDTEVSWSWIADEDGASFVAAPEFPTNAVAVNPLTGVVASLEDYNSRADPGGLVTRDPDGANRTVVYPNIFEPEDDEIAQQMLGNPLWSPDGVYVMGVGLSADLSASMMQAVTAPGGVAYPIYPTQLPYVIDWR